jgi:hypothetical protein
MYDKKICLFFSLTFCFVLLSSTTGIAMPATLNENNKNPVIVSLKVTPLRFADESMILYLSFDENQGNLAHDASIYINTGNLYNFEMDEDSGWTQGISGSALRFDGADDYIVIPDFPSLDVAEGLTIMGWVYLEEHPDQTEWNDFRFIVGKPGIGVYGILLEENWVGLSGSVFIGGKRQKINAWNDPSEMVGRWTHFAYTYDALLGEARIYVDGKLANSAKQTMGIIDANNESLRISSLSPASGPSHTWNGKIDEICVYNRPLTGDEIREHYRWSKNGLTDDEIQFSWTYHSAIGSIQRGYHIKVGVSPRDNSLWDTGEVHSDNRWTTYEGKELEKGRRYWVSIRVRDVDERWSKWKVVGFMIKGLDRAWTVISGIIAALIIAGTMMICLRPKYVKKFWSSVGKFEPLFKWLESRAGIYSPFPLLAISMLVAIFGSEVTIFWTYLIILIIFLWRDYDFRLLLVTSLCLLAVSGVVLITLGVSQANSVAIWAFYFLVTSVIGFLVKAKESWS